MILAKLAAHMDKKEISKAALAVRTGLSVETIENARKGKSVSRSTFTLISQVLKLKEDDLVEKAEKAVHYEKCPMCGAREVVADSPRTVYACGSSDYDQRPNTFTQGANCNLVMRGEGG